MSLKNVHRHSGKIYKYYGFNMKRVEFQHYRYQHIIELIDTFADDDEIEKFHLDLIVRNITFVMKKLCST